MNHATPSTTALLADAAAAALASDDRRLWDLIYALQERASRDVFEAAAAWCRSPSPPMRRLGVDPTLIALTRDTEAAVRQLATSGLGGFDREDTEDVRLALVERLEDTDAETREEAIFALAQLGDDRVAAALRAALEEPETSELIEMAAMAVENRGHTGRPLLRPN